MTSRVSVSSFSHLLPAQAFSAFYTGTGGQQICANRSQHCAKAKRPPTLFTCPVVLFYTWGSIVRWKEKEPIVRNSIEITKLACHILTGVLHERVCIETLFLQSKQLWAAFTYLSLLQCLFWAIQQLEKCRIKFLLSVPCCTLLHFASTAAFWSSHFGPSSQTA